VSGLVIESLSVSYGGVALIRGLSLQVTPESFCCLLGRSGCGKSTVLRAVARLVTPGGGRIMHDGRAALMTQSDALLPWADAVANVTIGDRLRGQRPDRARAEAILSETGLATHLHKRPDEMSGGMRQRVALARTLYEDRPLVLLDEPFAALDALTRREMQALARRMLAGRTVLMVTHDPYEAVSLGDAVAVIGGRPARIVCAFPLPGAPGLRDPAHPGLETARTAIMAALGPAAEAA
jgi:putative hydroxymethylpyrimidine transport system ATP-binding protein